MLDLQQPILLTLIGQSKLENPRQEIQQAMECIKQKVKDKKTAGDLLALMGALIEGKELIDMVKHYALDNRYFERSPLLQEMHRRGWDEGLLEGEKRGEEAGIIKGRKQGEELRFIQAQAGNILELLHIRLQLQKGSYDYGAFWGILQQMERQQLQQAFYQAATCTDIEAFKDWLKEHLPTY